jgi:hypothetical protein
MLLVRNSQVGRRWHNSGRKSIQHLDCAATQSPLRLHSAPSYPKSARGKRRIHSFADPLPPSGGISESSSGRCRRCGTRSRGALTRSERSRKFSARLRSSAWALTLSVPCLEVGDWAGVLLGFALQGGEEEVWASGEAQGLCRPSKSLSPQGRNHQGTSSCSMLVFAVVEVRQLATLYRNLDQLLVFLHFTSCVATCSYLSLSSVMLVL